MMSGVPRPPPPRPLPPLPPLPPPPPPPPQEQEQREATRRALNDVFYLALGGGGVQGFLLLGMFDTLAKEYGVDWGAGVPHRLRGASGSSVGALFVLMSALGMSAAEMAAEAEALPQIAAPTLATFLHGDLALDDGSRLRAMLRSLLLRRLGVADVTLAELRRRTGVDLVFVATDLTTKGVRYLRAATDGDVSTVKAVMASMAVPLLFPPVRLRGHTLVDGCLQDSIPVLLWPPRHVFGAAFMYNIAPVDEGIGGYLSSLLVMCQLTHEISEWAALPSAVRARVLLLDSHGQTSLPNARLGLTAQRRRELVAMGRASTVAGLARWPLPATEVAALHAHRRRRRDGDVAHCLPPTLRARRVQPLFYDLLASSSSSTVGAPSPPSLAAAAAAVDDGGGGGGDVLPITLPPLVHVCLALLLGAAAAVLRVPSPS